MKIIFNLYLLFFIDMFKLEREPILSQLQKSPTDNTNNTLPVKRKLLFDETLLNDIIAAGNVINHYIYLNIVLYYKTQKKRMN